MASEDSFDALFDHPDVKVSTAMQREILQRLYKNNRPDKTRPQRASVAMPRSPAPQALPSGPMPRITRSVARVAVRTDRDGILVVHRKLKVVDLCCGIGGAACGYSPYAKTVLAIDNDPAAVKVFREAFPGACNPPQRR